MIPTQHMSSDMGFLFIFGKYTFFKFVTDVPATDDEVIVVDLKMQDWHSAYNGDLADEHAINCRSEAQGAHNPASFGLEASNPHLTPDPDENMKVESGGDQAEAT
ncbi:hypothetical protein N7528_009281 [Penicillium herquei]|nr:hypothetical protein N7528_009281 [Penicillium herquei]